MDGFKSFVDFGLDVQPFTALLGPNAGGKSNLIDALEILARIAESGDLNAALASGRGVPAELFHQREDETRVEEARLSCDVLSGLPPELESHGPVGLEYTGLLRYEPSLPRVRIQPDVTGWSSRKLERLQPRGASAEFVKAVNAATGLTTPDEHVKDISGFSPMSLYGQLSFGAMVDGRQRGMWLLGQEVRGWQFLSLAPAAMRDRALKTDAGPLTRDGRNLAAVLGRISGTDAMWGLVADAVALISGLQDVRAVSDRDFWEFQLKFRGTGWISPRIASDGTLRVIAMLAAIHDPDYSGVLVIDEVENGLHPARLTELLRRLRNRVTDWRDGAVPAYPTRQVILTTHSPVVLSALYPEHSADLVFLSSAYRPETVEGRRVGSLVTVAQPVGHDGVPPLEVRRVLETVQAAG
jgi:predicted ATPase